MRLEKVERGHRLLQKIILAIIRLTIGVPVADVVRTMLYRPEFFGSHFCASLHDALRGPSEWTVGERELFAAFVSRQNRCPF